MAREAGKGPGSRQGPGPCRGQAGPPQDHQTLADWAVEAPEEAEENDRVKQANDVQAGIMSKITSNFTNKGITMV